MRDPIASLHPVEKAIEADARTARSVFIEDIRRLRDDSARQFVFRTEKSPVGGALTWTLKTVRAFTRPQPAWFVQSLDQVRNALRSDKSPSATELLFKEFSYEVEVWCEKVREAIRHHAELLFRLSPESAEREAEKTLALLYDECGAWFPDPHDWVELERMEQWPVDLNTEAGALAVLKGSLNTETITRLSELVKRVSDRLRAAMALALEYSGVRARVEYSRVKKHADPLEASIREILTVKPKISNLDLSQLVDDAFYGKGQQTPLRHRWRDHKHRELVECFSCPRCGNAVKVMLSKIRREMGLISRAARSRRV